MGEDEHRQIARDSLFVMAGLRVDGAETEHKIRVRNLSSGGLMAEGGPRVTRGQQVAVNVRDHGWIEGSVAWVQDNRFGIAFHEEIDPKAAVAPPPAEEPDYLVRRPIAVGRPPATPPGSLRKI